MTTRGADAWVPARATLAAWRACSLYGRLHTQVDGDLEFLRSAGEGNIADFCDLDFAGEGSVRVRVRGSGKLFINIGPGANAGRGEIGIDSAGKWQVCETGIRSQVEGRQCVQLYFAGGAVDVDSLEFF